MSRKLGDAVRRNRWRRLLREAFRLSRPQLPPGVDLIVIPRPGAKPELAALLASLPRLAARVGRETGPPDALRGFFHSPAPSPQSLNPSPQPLAPAPMLPRWLLATLRVPGKVLGWGLIGLVLLYKLLLSPLLGPHCRFEPSCSTYFIQAVRKYGPVRGAGAACAASAAATPGIPEVTTRPKEG